MSQLGLPMSDERTERRRPERRAHGRLAVVVAVAVVAAIILGAFIGLRNVATGLLPGSVQDYPGPGSGLTTVEVQPGDTVSGIGQRLVDAGVVASTDAFVAAAEESREAEGIQPGQYELPREIPATQALSVLVDPASRKVDRATLPEGLTLDASLARLAEGTGLPREQFDAVAAKPTRVGLPDYADGKLEGFVFPASYEFDRETTAEQAVAATVKRYEQAADDVGLVAGAKELGVTPYEVVTVASLIEAEAPEEARAEVARVIYNRLDEDMPLQLDATVNYATGKKETNPSRADRAIDSPYNTYKYYGLPPTPIASPGEAALSAALEPAKGNWLYYVTVNLDTGETKFARTLAEHNRNVAELRRWEAENS